MKKCPAKMLAFGFVFVHLFITVNMAGDDIAALHEKNETQFKFLDNSSHILKAFDMHFDRVCAINHKQTMKTYGTIAAELITFRNFGKEDHQIDRIIDEETKFLIAYYYYNATLVDFQMEIFTNSFVAHLAKWMQLNFQACMKFHENNKRSEIYQNCLKIYQYLEVFATTGAFIRDSQFAKFKDNSVEITEDQSKREAIEELFKLPAHSRINHPRINVCENTSIRDQDEKKYCKIWISLLNDPKQNEFKQNHAFFDAFLNLRVITPYNFEHDDFLSDYKSSVKFWKFANKLVQYTQSSLVIRKNSNNGREAEFTVQSNVSKILAEIIQHKKDVLEERRK